MEKNFKKFRFIYFDKYGEKLFSVINVRHFTLAQALEIAEGITKESNGQLSIEVEQVDEELEKKKINKKKVEQNNRRIASEIQRNPNSFYCKKNSSSGGRRFY